MLVAFSDFLRNVIGKTVRILEGTNVFQTYEQNDILKDLIRAVCVT